MRDIALAVLLPGWTARARHRALAVGLALVGVAFPFAVAASAPLSGRNWVALSLDARFLAWLTAALVAALVARVVAVAEQWQHAGWGRPSNRRDVLALGLAVAVCAPLLVGAIEVGRARASIAPTFTASGGGSLFDPSAFTTVPAPSDDTVPVPSDPSVGPSPATTPTPTSSEPASTTTAPAAPPTLPKRPSSGIDKSLLTDLSTVLLLGGDAGPGRSGLRTDTMMLFSVHRPSGRAALISIPRDLRRLLFPPGTKLAERYPYGWDDLANAIYPIVSARPELRAAYEGHGDIRPGVVGLAHALGYSLDVTIDDYVLVDMQGFLELIDALGGVTVDVPKAVPMPGNVPGARTQYPDVIGPGIVHMDGTTALGYVRSRKADSDYQRTRRQRQLLASLATQVSIEDVVLNFGRIAAAVGGTLRTSLTPDELANTLAVIGGETAIVESVGLVPPLVDVNRPDYDQLARIVGEVQLALVTGERSGY